MATPNSTLVFAATPKSLSGMFTALGQSIYDSLYGFITFLPNLIAAIVVLVVGWFACLLLGTLVERGLRAIGMEKVGDFSGLNQFLEQSGSKWTTSHAVAILIRWLVFLIFIQAAATLLGVPQITQVINTLILYIPRIIIALVLMVIGGWVAKVLSHWIEIGLTKVGLETAGQRAGIDDFFQKAELNWTTVTAVVFVVRWFIVLIFLQAATSILGIPQLTQIINDIVFYLPNIAVAMLVLIVGVWVGKVAAGLLRASLANFEEVNPELVAKVAQYSIVGLSVVIALSQLKVAPIIVNTLFIGLISLLVLALGLSFGLGGREVAGKIVAEWYEKSAAIRQAVGEKESTHQIERPGQESGSDTSTSVKEI
ncbi:MAG: hypothetical protein ACFCD0_24975 [Gemmataceae bacterium]